MPPICQYNIGSKFTRRGIPSECRNELVVFSDMIFVIPLDNFNYMLTVITIDFFQTDYAPMDIGSSDSHVRLFM